MEFKFESSEEYQIAAINAAIALFEGQSFVRSQLVIPKGATFQVIANRLDLNEELIVANLVKVQGDQGLPVDGGLQAITAEIDTLAGKAEARFPNFSVEMETGTGKTYVYLRTAHRLFQQYGLRKFIVVVHSVAVREGVKKTLEVTKKHLDDLYDKPPYRYSVYDSANLGQVRSFALSDGIEIMVMTIDAFKRGETVIRKSREGQDPPIHWLQAVRPVLILDEPQNMESELSVAALATLNPLFALRYSATHRNPYNVIYRLTPYDAYRQGLVKRIEVASVVQEDNANLPFIRLDEIATKKRTLSASVAVHKLLKSGKIAETNITIKPEVDLAEKTGRPEYRGFIVEEINFGGGYIRFANNVEIRKGETKGVEKEAIFEAQIRFTIEEHFRKAARYRERGIKVLSLFFIDKVENYANDDGIIRKLFVKAFDDVKQRFPEWKDRGALEAQASYFASKTKKGGTVEFLDTSGKTKEDEKAFELIMQKKEQLLSFDEPVSFIFSHSALREGWDNPNVFQICTMREVGSETERRQQVGRGVRLPVDQVGDRIRDEQVNVLTVVASEAYEHFVAGLQGEIEREYGKEGLPPPPPNARKRTTINLRKHFLLKPEFKELWERIRPKTRYAVSIDTAKLIESVLPELDSTAIRKPRITIGKAELRAGATEDFFEAIVQSGARTAIDLAGRYPLPNLIEIMESLMENTSPPMRLSRKTLLSLYKRTKNQQAALDNPHEFAVAAVKIIKAKLADQLVDGIKYTKDGTWYSETLFKDEIENVWLDNLVSSRAVGGVGGTHLYDGVVFDSEGIEKSFVQDLEKRADVKLYIKLPDWFQVDTPIGRYNPDWAIVMNNPEDGDPVLYLVRETKGTLNLNDLRPDEKRKITCGRQHFSALGVDFKVVAAASDLPSGGL
jgi:type III restriction enzyme